MGLRKLPRAVGIEGNDLKHDLQESLAWGEVYHITPHSGYRNDRPLTEARIEFGLSQGGQEVEGKQATNHYTRGRRL